MPSKNAPDHSLAGSIARMRSGDAEARVQLAVLIGEIARRYLLKLGYSAAEAELIAEELLPAILRRLECPDFNHPNIDAWLRTVIGCRAAGKRRFTVAFDELTDAEQAKFLATDHRDRDEGAPPLSDDERQALAEALAKLGPLARLAVSLRFGDEHLPRKEIARRIGKSDTATGVLLLRALKKLNASLASDPRLAARIARRRQKPSEAA